MATSIDSSRAGKSEELVFISYAWEDGELALWLANTLLRHGFSVWIDRKRLLGGEQFPKEIEDAIGKQTIRFLALMSKASLNKESPRRERMLASKAAKKKGIKDFIIPIRADDLSPDEFDFVTTELTALDFSGNWAEGLRSLLKKFESIGIKPKPNSGFEELQSLIDNGENIQSSEERAISNLFEIKEIPTVLYGYRRMDVAGEWIHENRKRVFETDFHLWTFCEEIAALSGAIKPYYSTPWKNVGQAFDIRPRDVVVFLIESYIVGLCVEKGLLLEDKTLYFPVGLLPKDKIWYPNLDERQTYVTMTGTRTSHYKAGEPVLFRYYLGPELRCILDRLPFPSVRLNLKVRVTDLSGRQFKPKMALGRRKKTTRSWHNPQWVSRVMGIAHWLTSGQDLVLENSNSGRLVISGKLTPASIYSGINEENIKAKPQEDPFDSVADEVTEE